MAGLGFICLATGARQLREQLPEFRLPLHKRKYKVLVFKPTVYVFAVVVGRGFVNRGYLLHKRNRKVVNEFDRPKKI